MKVVPYREEERGVGAPANAEDGFRLVAPAFPGSPFWIGQRIEGGRVVWEDRCYSKPACPQS